MAIRIHKLFFVARFRIWGFWYSLFMKQAGNRLLMQKPVFVTPQHIICGNRVTIYNNARIEGVEKYNEKKFRPEIKLDDDVSIQQNVHITCAQSVWIKRNTAIAANVSITDINHPYTNITLPVEKQDIEMGAVEIGEDCKIYNNVVILPNVKLGKHCVVGANSVVFAGHYPDFSILAGSPAKIVKRYNESTASWEKMEA